MSAASAANTAGRKKKEERGERGFRPVHLHVGVCAALAAEDRLTGSSAPHADVRRVKKEEENTAELRRLDLHDGQGTDSMKGALSTARQYVFLDPKEKKEKRRKQEAGS